MHVTTSWQADNCITGSTLVKCGQTQQKLGQARRDLMQATTNNFLLQLKNFLETDVKGIQVAEPAVCVLRYTVCERPLYVCYSSVLVKYHFKLSLSSDVRDVICLFILYMYCSGRLNRSLSWNLGQLLIFALIPLDTWHIWPDNPLYGEYYAVDWPNPQ